MAAVNAVVWAERQAGLDIREIKARIETTGYDYSADRVLLVDGSQYSPSWRVLTGGAAVYRRAELNPGVVEVYEEVLDKLLPKGCYWSEGCLFYTKNTRGDD